MENMEKNQTAVEWFASELHGHLAPSNGPELLAILNQAKEMEKEQIIEAFNSGQAKEASECFWTKGNFYYENKYGQHTDSNL